MINLIKKDMFLIRTSGYFKLFDILTFLIFPLFLLSSSKSSFYVSFTVANLLFAALCSEIQLGEEVRMNTNYLLLSLPIKRSNIVISKYVVAFINQLVFCILLFIYLNLYLYNRLGINWNIKEIDYTVVLFALSISLIFISINMLFYYLFQNDNKFSSVGIFVLVFYGMQIALKYIDNAMEYSIISFIVSIAILLASMKLSIKLYEDKEF